MFSGGANLMFDLVIRNALIFDGSGQEPFVGALAVSGERIVSVGAVAGEGRCEIDAAGLALAPGFIDVHTHDDRLLLIRPDMAPKVSQGVTTVVAGNCGISLAPVLGSGQPHPPMTLLGQAPADFHRTFAHYLDALRRAASATNVVPFVGHSAIRLSVLETVDRDSTAAERITMQALTREAMEAGAFGVSTGLYYPPAQAASPGEVEAVLDVAADFGGMQTTHMRDEGDHIFEAMEEALGSAHASGLPLVISHLKCAAPSVWGRAAKLLARIDKAALVQDVAFDVYPYDASSTMLDPNRLEGSRRIMVSWSATVPEVAGQDLDAIAACWCCSPQDAARRLIPGGGIYFKMEERDIKRILTHPLAMIGSDGLPHDNHPHPRLWGTFPRVLGLYVRDRRVLSLAEAIRRMTALPADVFGLKDRGLIGEGHFADLVLFNPADVMDTATYEVPTTAARGISAVFVNGEAVWNADGSTKARPGKVLTRGTPMERLRMRRHQDAITTSA
jgi:N-acyl-D-amino-acid deacylase